MLNTTNTELSFIELWIIDQNRVQFEIEYNVYMTLING